MKRRSFLGEPEVEKILDVNASMQGTLRFDDPVNLRINGKFEGTLNTKGKLIIGEKAEIKANIFGETITIAGSVKGNIKAAKELSLGPTAKLFGDIETPKISISEGAILDGRLSMSQISNNGISHVGEWLTTGELAKYLEVDMDRVSYWANSGMLPANKEEGEWKFEKSKIDLWISEGRVKV